MGLYYFIKKKIKKKRSRLAHTIGRDSTIPCNSTSCLALFYSILGKERELPQEVAFLEPAKVFSILEPTRFGSNLEPGRLSSTGATP